jgi:PKHD-type hydroxylase
MIYEIDLLNDDQIKKINDIIEFSDYESGMMSANYTSEDIKNNLQVKGYEREELISYVVDILNNSNDFTEITSSKSYSGLLFSKYEKGMYYRMHNDNYMMNGSRTDFSSTIFLNDPTEYEGGELVIKLGNQEFSYKLDAGKCLIYPTGLLHEVKEVTSGVRKVCVFWTESCIADKEIRSMMADFHFMWSKYYDEAYEKLGQDFCAQLQNIKFNLMRRYGNFSGVLQK